MSFAVFRKTVTVKRVAPGSYGADGFWQEGAETTLTITASVQPATQEDMQLLPEGRRVTGTHRLYTADVLYLARDGRNADRVVIDDDDYEVMAASDWQNGIVPHRRYVVSRIVEGTA